MAFLVPALVGALLLATSLVGPPPASAVEPSSLQARIDSATPGSEVLVRGVERGPIVVRKPLRVTGEPGAVIDGGGQGTVVVIASPGVFLSRLTLRGSGGELNTEDAGVYVTAPAAVLQDIEMEDVLFGINLKQAHGTIVRRVTMSGKDLPLSRRGDAVRVWYSDRVTLTEVTIRGMRDVLLWFSKESMLHALDVRDSRYGVHYMYADDTPLLNSHFEGNAVGAYVMYSTRVRIEGNRFLSHRGAVGVGLALKESDDVRVRGNLFAGNGTGIYVDGTPLRQGGQGEITGNVVAGNDVGLSLLSNVSGNTIWDNVFEANAQQIRVDGGAQTHNVWQRNGRGNYWSDYAGLDIDGDGVGDSPYRARRWFEGLGDVVPGARLLWGSTAVTAVDFAARAVPVFAPQLLITDPRPLMRPHIPPAFRGGGGSTAFALASLTVAVLGAVWLRAATGKPSWKRQSE
jgi:nitrous oxidase accessory protein